METQPQAEIRMHAERTPNPDSIKWVLDRSVVSERGGVPFRGAVAAEVSPVAASLLEIEGVDSVLLGANFVSVNKAHEAEWTDLAPDVVRALKTWAASGADALGPAWKPPERAEDDEVVGRIRRILEQEVQPYVERDGGEIVFAGFAEGVVQVHLQGACSGCPSSSITLKMAIEGRLKEAIPEVDSVVAV